jgi:hypothetical protein
VRVVFTYLHQDLGKDLQILLQVLVILRRAMTISQSLAQRLGYLADSNDVSQAAECERSRHWIGELFPPDAMVSKT